MIGARTLAVIALAGALVGAGCVGIGGGEDEGVEATSEDTNSSGADPPSQTRTTRTNTTRNETGSPDQPTLSKRTVSFEGQLGAEAVACGPGGCAGTFLCVPSAYCGTPVADPRTERSFPVEHEGPLEAVNLTLTWGAASPVTEALRMGLAWDCEDGCSYTYVEGPSPLTFEESELRITSELSIFVWTPDQGPTSTPTSVHVTHDQPFTIEGAVVTGPAS